MHEEHLGEIRNLLEVEPSTPSAPDTNAENDYREQLAVLVASGRAKEMIGIELTQDQVKSVSAKDVEKYFKRYEASLSSKTCDAMVDTFLELSCKILDRFLPLDSERLFVDLNENFMVKKELSMIAGRLSLKYGKYMAGFSAALLPVNNFKPSEHLGEQLGEQLQTNFEEPVKEPE